MGYFQREFTDFPMLHEKVAYYLWENIGFDDTELNGLMAAQLIRGTLKEHDEWNEGAPYHSVSGFVDGFVIGYAMKHDPCSRDSMIDALARGMVTGNPKLVFSGNDEDAKDVA